MKKAKTCSIDRCTNSPRLGGLCAEHAEEEKQKSIRRRDAIETLHMQAIDKSLATEPSVKKDLSQICEWWHKACISINTRFPHPILRDEAEYAAEWCISLAQELIDAERAYRTGSHFDNTVLKHTREWVWERFRNLELGLMSNGVAVPKR